MENRGGNDKDTDPTDNTHTVKIGTDGTVNLTTIDEHQYYISAGQSTTVTGHQVAHVSFEHEIDFSHNFSMSGALGIGSKSSGGADSVGFVFAPGDPAKATQGGSGGELGLGGLANAFGFVFDEYYNRDKNDPSSSPYIGWRATDANGKLQSAPSKDWRLASQAGLNDRSVETLNAFSMNYDASTQMLTVVLGKNGVALTRKIIDVSSGYSLSVSASTGGSWNDYSARIDQFSYTPKTIPLTINLVDTADSGALLDKTNANVVANIGDTVSVFSTQAAADRAVALGEVKPNLVSVLPTDSAGNVYVIDSSATIANNKGTAVHYIGGTQNKALADATYYTYTVADGDGQNMTVPVRLAFTAVVTPVDSQTQQPIPGLKPVTVVTVAGEPALVQIPGYTPTQVVLDAPADGQKVVQDNLLINQGTANPDGTTPTTKTSDAIAHYYTATGTTVDGQTVTTTGTVGTGQAVANNLNGQPFKDATGNPIASGGQTAIGQNDYYWSEVGNATATDSTDTSHPQTAGSVLVPTVATLKYWDQQAIANQTDADNYKAEAQDTFNQFVALKGLTEAQTKTAQASLDALKDLYDNVSNSNGVAKANFEKAMQETNPATIYQDGQTGYDSLMKAINFLANFKADVEKLDTKNTDAKASLVTLARMDRVYGDPIGVPDAEFGAGFGTLTPEQQADFNKVNYFEFVNQADMSGGAVVPKNVGSYMVNVTDAGRAYLRSLNPDNPNLGLFVSTFLTISPKPVNATINTDSETDKAVKVTYGDTPEVTGDLDGMIDSDKTDNPISPSDFEVIDTATGKPVSASDLQVTGRYMVQYTAAAQAKFKKNANYDFKSFGNAPLIVTRKAITVTAQDTGKAYGDPTDPILTLTSESSAGLVDGDQLANLGVKLSRKTGENADSYDINQDPSSTLNPNYKVTVTPGTFTIVKLPVTVTVASDEIHYGDKTPSFKLTDDAKAVLVNGDDLTKLGAITYTCNRAKSIGSYTISGSATDLNSNYTVTVKDGTLKVTPRPVTIEANTLSKYYGDSDPRFTYKVVS
ncbi:lectin-like domain-containing protein, partial [Lactiplantibacillus pingfangensis]|uniref:lectin-like domain-containing protein n=1 Tax=Lactiplantibacillus pingfangensis TaxID=2559915 RepID=UPI0010F8A072